MRDMVGFEKSHKKLNCIVIFEDIPISRQKQNFYAYRENEKMSEKLTDKFNAGLSGYVPAAPGWYLREQNNAGKNVYYPVWHGVSAPGQDYCPMACCFRCLLVASQVKHQPRLAGM